MRTIDSVSNSLHLSTRLSRRENLLRRKRQRATLRVYTVSSAGSSRAALPKHKSVPAAFCLLPFLLTVLLEQARRRMRTMAVRAGRFLVFYAKVTRKAAYLL